MDALLLANFQNEMPVHFQQLDRSASSRCQTAHPLPFPGEVLTPYLPSRMKQRGIASRHRIRRMLPGCLAQRTGDTSEGQILELGFTAFNNGMNVVDMKRSLLPFLR